MANILEARVKQKKDTLENWEANPMILLDGEQAFVVSDSGQPVNFKIGDGTKRFSELPYWIDYAGGQYIQIAGNVLPEPTVDVGYSLVGPGTYTFAGQDDIIAPEGRLSQLLWDGSSWSLVDMGELPQVDTSGFLEKKDFSSDNIFKESMLVGMNISTNNTIQINASAKSFYYQVKEGDNYLLYRDSSLSNRFTYGFTSVIPVAGTPVSGVVNTSLTQYLDIVAPFDGYIIVYLSSPTDVSPVFSNIIFSKQYIGRDYALKSELDSVKNNSISYDNIFEESKLKDLVLDISNNVISSATGKSFYIPVNVTDILDLSRVEALSNRFTYGFTSVEPAPTVPVSNIVDSSLTEYRNIIPPFNGYLFIYLSNGTDASTRDFSNIILTNKSQLKPVDNLNSEDVNRPLSANQGRILKDLIDNGGGGSSPKTYMFGKFNEIYRSPDMPNVSPEGGDPDLTTMTHVEFITLIDDLMTQYPLGFSKNILGYGANASNEPDSTLPIVEYTIIPESVQPAQVTNGGYLSDAPVVLISCGLHGDEKLAPWVLYNFIKQMLENPADDILSSIRNNVILKFVPLFNPYGFELNKRGNINGVDLNRNFAHADPQQETIVAKQWAEDNSNCLFFIDFHNNYYSQAGLSYCITDNEFIARSMSSMFRRISPLWKSKYFTSQVDNYTRGHVRALSSVNGFFNTYLYYVINTLNITDSSIVEFTKSWTDNIVWYKSEPSEIGIDTLSNSLISLIGFNSR